MSKNNVGIRSKVWPGYNTALGSYQSHDSAKIVLKKLRRNGFRHSLSIQRTAEGYIHAHILDERALLMTLVLATLIGLLSFALPLSMLGVLTPLLIILPFVLWACYFVWIYRTNSKLLQRYKCMVIRDETLIVALVREEDVLQAMALLRSVEAYYPAAFLLRSDTMHWQAAAKEPFKEPLPLDAIQAYAAELAAAHQCVKTQNHQPHPLQSLEKSISILKNIIHRLGEAQHIEQNVTLSANWFLDNAYVIEENSKAVESGLPKKYYRQLPKLVNPPMQGVPRVYAIADGLINCTGNVLNHENIATFLKSYLAVTPLTIGELWALPLFLKLKLLECLEQLAIELDRRVTEAEIASFWENRLCNAARIEPERLEAFLEHLKNFEKQPSPHFAEELIEHLFDEDVILPAIKTWVEEALGSNIVQIMQKEQLEETQNGIAISSAIVSLISLSQMAWKAVFESISPVDAILKDDPAEVYAAMNFTTRDSYRHAIEVLARRSGCTESDIATLILQMAQLGKDPASRHVGYYLIDAGRDALETFIHYPPTAEQRVRRFMTNHSALIYFGGIAAMLLAIEGLLYMLSWEKGLFLSETLLFLGMAILPVSEIGIQLFNAFLPHILPPHILPKMCFDAGIPEKYKTLVVIPCMLTSSETTKEIFNNLEIHYLANNDPALKFGVLFDFADAPNALTPADQKLLDDALHGMQALEQKHGANIFFLFLRERLWNASESTWIGWERKRGKLENLNRFLTDGTYPGEFLRFGQREHLTKVRFVLTLDIDTKLPKDRAKQLIETLAHPLNAVQLSAENHVKRGYTIIQPRVLTDFSQAKKTLFSRIFSDFIGVDPYTLAISDVYQDLMHEGTYHGKCLYDVQAFNRILTECFPENHLLSHDLLEGAYVRVGYTSDIALYDNFPETYFAWSKRQHRWMRGDWQIIDWLFAHVPAFANKWKRNPLSGGNRWKIFDNLRRALLSPAMMALLSFSWLFSSVPVLWTNLVLLVLFMPTLATLVHNLLAYLHAKKTSWKSFALGALRAVITAALLPHQAMLALDALFRVIYRRLISHKFLLEWSTNDHGGSDLQYRRSILRLLGSTLFASILFALVVHYNPTAIAPALPFCLLWALSPLLVFLLGEKSLLSVLSPHRVREEQREPLRKIARKTWRYFDDFVQPETQWLPPDNFQAALMIEVAERTSPTNIGLWLLSVLSAYDLKYLSVDDAIARLLATFQTINKLEFHQGHLLNWYNTRTLEPLHPKYVSTVDNGNFLASLWTLQQGMSELIAAPVLPFSFVEGLEDSFNILLDEKPSSLPAEKLHLLRTALSDRPKNLSKAFLLMKTALNAVQDLLQYSTEQSQALYWLKALEKQILAWEQIRYRYFEWMDMLNEILARQPDGSDAAFFKVTEEIESMQPSLQMLADGSAFLALNAWLESSEASNSFAEGKHWAERLRAAMQKAQWLAGEKIGEVGMLMQNTHEMSESKDMSFLYNQERKLFSIGYHVEQCRCDNCFYDLLASEARIASLVSIAKGDVPLEHWWSLGRPYKVVKGMQVLVSWGGTMFEYLMPLLFTRHYPDSLLGNACQNAVRCQISYGKQRGIPWGISESAFSEIDGRKVYQYRSFGVPQLGFKSGLEKDLVVSPYSSLLALAINPSAALKNLQTLSQGKKNLYAPYGYYEAIDFTRVQEPTGEPGSIVFAYMAHHQGMSLISINNALNNNVMMERFHKDPRIKGVESLLYERIPLSPPAAKGVRPMIPLSRLVPLPKAPMMGMIDTPHTRVPKVNLLANGEYSVMLTNTGGGYSKWKDVEITRWRSDSTCDNWGSFCYIKNRSSGEFWSLTYHPTYTKGQRFSVEFKSDKVEFRRKDNHIDTTLEIFVSPQENAEIRQITLANLSQVEVDLELTSYSELALAPHRADRQHPCFNKLFIQTEALPSLSGLLAFRRLRASDDMPIWAGHLVAAEQPHVGDFQFETDRAQFVGRGNFLSHPDAMKGDLKNSQGYTLDPIFSIRHRVILKPGQRTQVAFVTVIADNRDTAIELMKKYQDITVCLRAQAMAWTHAQLEFRHLRIHQEEAQLFQRIASYILFPHSHLRPFAERLRKNRLDQSALWPLGISGDLPIVAVTIADGDELHLVKQMLTAHAFWRMRGLKVDLVILNEEITSYEHPVQDALTRFIHSHAAAPEIGKPGGVYLLSTEQIQEEQLSLILCVARAHFVGARGFLRHHLVSPMKALRLPQRLTVKSKAPEEPSRPLPFLELPYFNGIGGFQPDGKEYAIYLGPHTQTPAPWINVMANPDFGTLVSETGLGCTWYGNSQTNRLTPWSNDPLLNPISDLLYIRDDERAIFWNPTPAPIRELDAYRVRHGQGYSRFEHNSHGIEQELLIFIPVDSHGGAPVRIQQLRLTNASSHKRILSIFSFTELVLGNDKEHTQMHVITDWDLESQAIFATNHYNTDYGSHVAFISASQPPTSYTGDRTEFIGRNHHLANPAALKRETLSNNTGTGFDPCAALQIKIELAPGETQEIAFILGYAPEAETARSLAAKWGDLKQIEQGFAATKSWWDQLLSTVQIETPELYLNIAMNRWLLYQDLSCRLWGRTAFYQSSGAFGFRDQLQDSLALLYAFPQIARQQILRAASRQFVEGDVQHWWHPPNNVGVRTRISDDLLWLPFAVAQYIRVTNDRAILLEEIPFITGALLKEEEHEAFFVPEISNEKASLWEHCRRAMRKGVTAGPHGLPLIGGGDWNDGMNLVGQKGSGESVWLAWFLIHVMHDCAFLLTENGEDAAAAQFQAEAMRLADTVEKTAWDGKWYRRAYFDDGTPLGSNQNEEDRIDALPQAWAAICGLANPERVAEALRAVEEHLVRVDEKLVLLLTPPFDKTDLQPGYIKGYPPGVRENGGQYTHGSLWVPMAFARLGFGDKAAAILKMMHPVMHSLTPEMANHYKIEPYVTAGDVYALPGQVGKGGWSWYTGSQAWMYRIWLEEILGFQLRGNKLKIHPTLPKEWHAAKINYTYKSTLYLIAIENPEHIADGKFVTELDGMAVANHEILLVDDQRTHNIRVILTPKQVAGL